MIEWLKNIFKSKQYTTKEEGELLFSTIISISRKLDLQPDELVKIMNEEFLNEMYAHELANLLKQRKEGEKYEQPKSRV